jgi:hypothetical protein
MAQPGEPMRSLLLSLVFLASCGSSTKSPPTPQSNPTTLPQSKITTPSETQPKKTTQAWKTFIVDYSFTESGGTAGARGEVHLCSDGYFEVSEAGKPLASMWLSAAEVDSLAIALTETNWEPQKSGDRGIPAKLYKLQLSAPNKKLSLEDSIVSGSKGNNAAAVMIEELRKKALSTRDPGNKAFSIEIIGESTGGTVPVLVSTRIASNGAVSRSANLGAQGTTINGAQLIPLRYAYSAFDANSLPAKLPEKDPSGMFVHTTTVKLTGDVNKTIIRTAEGMNASPTLEPELASFMHEVMFIADRALSASSTMRLTLSCEQHGVAISTEKFSIDTTNASFSENDSAPTEKKLDEFMLSTVVGVLKSPQMQVLLREKPTPGPEMPGVKKCALSFTIGSDVSSVNFSSADQYSKASKEAMASLWSTLQWVVNND